MAKNGKRGRRATRRDEDHAEEPRIRNVSAEALRGVAAVLLFALAAFFALASFGIGGSVGTWLFEKLSFLFGVGYALLPLSLALTAIALLRQLGHAFGIVQSVGILIFFFSGLGLIDLALPERGGIIGNSIAHALVTAVDSVAAAVFLIAFIVVAFVISFDVHLYSLFAGLREKLRAMRTSSLESDAETEREIPTTGLPSEEEAVARDDAEEESASEAEPEAAPEPEIEDGTTEDAPAGGFLIAPARASSYTPPPLSLLGKNKGKPEVGDVKANMNIIKRTLQNFGITVEMDEISIGPTVTRYAMKPAEGVRLSKIVALQSNLELALAASPIRIEAPIPGKSLVGIEVPNIARTTLGLGPLLADPAYAGSEKPLMLGLGRAITGAPHFADLARMPHMLVAGTTGAGKTCGKDTYVFSERGMLTFEELCPLPLNSEAAYELRVATRDGVETTSRNYNNGICDFYRITTAEGFSIDVTAEHPLWVMHEGAGVWQNGSGVRPGEYVAISRGAQLFGADTRIDYREPEQRDRRFRDVRIPKEMTPELGLFLGLLSADGGLTVKNRIVYTQANQEVLDIYKGLLKKLFGVEAPAVAKSGKSNKAKDVIVMSARLKDFLAHLGMGAAGAKEKTIPRSVRAAPKETVRAYLQGLVRNDGHVSDRGLEIALASETLIRQMQVLLLNFGVVASAHEKTVKAYEQNAYWRLSVYGDDFALYAEEIGFLTDEERKRAAKVIARARNTNKNVVPSLEPLLRKLALLYRSAFARMTQGGWQYAPGMLVPKYAFRSLPSYAAGWRNPSYPALARILDFYAPVAEAPEYKALEKIRSDNFYWARVERVERTRGEGYDFEVPGSHSFVGNGFINHNSVAIHDFIISLLYRNGPERLRFIMVDPKRVELTFYNSIPHLLTPVITDSKKTILALKWLAKEMERRYNILETERVRDIASYHTNVVAPALEKANGSEAKLPEAMPYIVLVIDELADIMQTYPRELEAGIVRLAQMSRAVGIHLILSTQRPSVKVITGLIKANVPARVAFQVASQIDSRTILDTGGAEKLLGAGDMLFLSGEMSKPRRLQSPYISEQEVKRVVSFIAKENESEALSEITLGENGARESDPLFSLASLEDAAETEEDDLYDDARRAVMEAGKASTSYLQRKLGVGYSRAAKLMDTLESRGVIGPADGSKPRDVINAGNAEEPGNEEKN